MENNNEVERAKAWFELVPFKELYAIIYKHLPHKNHIKLFEIMDNDDEVVFLYNAEHPQQPQREAEQTYSIEEAAIETIQFLLSAGNKSQAVRILEQYHHEKLSQIKDSKTAGETPGESRIIQVIKAIPQQPQVQYDLQRQLSELRVAANRLGLYDAADFIK